MGAKKADHGILKSLVKDIDAVFKGDAVIMSRLAISRETWLKICGDSGVKQEKCRGMVKSFFNTLLADPEDIDEDDHEINDQFFKIARNKYLTDIENHNFMSYVIRVKSDESEH